MTITSTKLTRTKLTTTKLTTTKLTTTKLTRAAGLCATGFRVGARYGILSQPATAC